MFLESHAVVWLVFQFLNVHDSMYVLTAFRKKVPRYVEYCTYNLYAVACVGSGPVKTVSVIWYKLLELEQFLT